MTTKPTLSLCRMFFGLLLVLSVSSSYAQKVQKLDSLFTILYNKGGFNGCVLIAEDGKPIYDKAFGYADFATKRLLDNNTVFELASVSKQFTAMAIMQLHQAGKLSYDDSVKKYLPEFPYHKITINNLLHHTSGLPEFLQWGDKMIDVNRFNYNADILASLVKNKPIPNALPGDAMSYSNTNYVLLALIVERVSGMPFSKYLDSHIFKPLGMMHTAVYMPRASKKKIKDYAQGHMYDPAHNDFIVNDSLPSLRYQYYFDGVAGPYGISSNTADMLKWDQALYTEQLVSQKEQALAYVPEKLNNGKNAQFAGMDYGFGWMVFPKGNFGPIYVHSGGYPGYTTIIYRMPELKKTIIILTNTWGMADIYELGGAVMTVLVDQPLFIPEIPVHQKSIALNAAQLKAIEGTYNVSDAFKITITNEKGQTYAQLTGQPKAEIYPESETNFFYSIVKANIKFTKDSDGKIKTLELLQNGGDVKATKAD